MKLPVTQIKINRQKHSNLSQKKSTLSQERSCVRQCDRNLRPSQKSLVRLASLLFCDYLKISIALTVVPADCPAKV